MYNLVRNLVFYSVILSGVLAGITIYFYGTADPCRILAKRQSDDTIQSVNEIFGEHAKEMVQESPSLEGLFRAITVQYSTRNCAREMKKIWMDDLTSWWDQLMN